MTSDVRLRPMTDAEYETWRAASLASYAEDLGRIFQVGPDVATQKATDQFAQMLPDGRTSADNHLLAAEDSTDGTRVGSLWLRYTPGTGDAFIADLSIDESRRGRGLGRGTMLAAEEYVRDLGAKGLALHVFGHNPRAIHLYEQLGYAMTSQNMRKDLGSE